ncbi:MAG: Na+/Ca+ antiporter, CaCA family [Petrotoga mobilis]|nr:MAG: Na+/Ca+ antiporter, CaCA family [Petrotoga mobilis]
MVNILLIALGIFLLIRGADRLIEGALGLTRKAGVSELFAGLTVVAFGTSAPELVVTISSSIKGASVGLGNVLGSNVANIGLILGISFLISPTKIQKSTVNIEMPFLLIISVVIFAMIMEGNSVLTRYDGMILITFLLIFMAYLYYMAKNDQQVRKQLVENEEMKKVEKEESWAKIITFSALGLAMLIIGGELTVNNSIIFAKSIGISESLIGVTIVAIGTSLPELVTAIVAAIKHSDDIVLGNIVGSNTFNIAAILGISALINGARADRPVTFDVSYGLLLALVLLLGTMLKKDRKVGRGLGAFLFSLYVLYIIISIQIG